MKTVQVECSCCGKKFERRRSDVNYRKKHGMRIYCSAQCVGKENSSQLKSYQYQEGHAATNIDPQKVYLSPFLNFLRRTKNNAMQRKKECLLYNQGP